MTILELREKRAKAWEAAKDRMPSAKPSSTALFASIHVSLSMRWDSLARDSPVLIS